MVLLLDERPVEKTGLQRSLVDLDAIETGLHLIDQEDVVAWPTLDPGSRTPDRSSRSGRHAARYVDCYRPSGS